MATYYAVNAGGVWTTGATWSTVSAKDASRVGGSVAPTNADDCIADDYSGSLTVSSTAAAKTFNCAINGNYAGTLTINASIILAISGSITFSTTMTIAGTGILRISAASSITTNGKQIPNLSLYYNGNITLLDALTVAGAITQDGTAPVFVGAFNITCATLTFCFGTITLVSGQTLTVTSTLNINKRFTDAVITLKASTASSAAFFNFSGSIANCNIAQATFTDIDASGSAQGLDNWYGGTLTRTTNITNRTGADFATAAQADSIISGTTISGVAGTYHEATEAEVQSGITFGPSSSYTGTYVGGGGGGLIRHPGMNGGLNG